MENKVNAPNSTYKKANGPTKFVWIKKVDGLDIENQGRWL